jgi:hypothetical protein
MASDQNAVRMFALGQIDDLSAGINDPGPSVWINQQFRLNTAHSKILSLILAFNAPIDLLTAQRIDADKALHQINSREYHHFFPRDYLLSRGVPARKVNALANFVMLTAASNKKITNRAPSEYLQEVASELGSDLKPALETNLVSDAAYAAALSNDYDTFLEERARTIAHRVRELTGW